VHALYKQAQAGPAAAAVAAAAGAGAAGCGVEEREEEKRRVKNVLFLVRWRLYVSRKVICLALSAPRRFLRTNSTASSGVIPCSISPIATNTGALDPPHVMRCHAARKGGPRAHIPAKARDAVDGDGRLWAGAVLFRTERLEQRGPLFDDRCRRRLAILERPVLAARDPPKKPPPPGTWLSTTRKGGGRA
jgi:hypothetical protein